MPTATPVPTVNRLLSGLPRKERDQILDCAEPVQLVFGDILCDPHTHFQHVYFPIRGFISLVAPMVSKQPLEMGLIGNEGMLGATVMLGVNTVPLRALVQGSGNALRVTVPKLRRVLRDSPVLQRTLNRYLYIMMAQLAQTAVCTRFHEVDARLARWLLMSHDRAHADHFHLTHKFLADMLGVRRSGVTIAAGLLQQKKVISYTRGNITILDRKGLEAVSCVCYDAVVEDYARQFD